MAGDVHARTTVLAPVAGAIVKLRLNTIGGVVRPGDTLLEILPSDDKLLVEARVRPDDIDSVQTGLPARVSITALDQRQSSPLLGEVVHVSADRLIEESTGLPYYMARVKILGEGAGNENLDVLKAGMNAEVMIVTGERTVFDYLLGPITQSLRRAMRRVHAVSDVRRVF
jgi:HlyD family type I secretion membrane fusion protein